MDSQKVLTETLLARSLLQLHPNLLQEFFLLLPPAPNGGNSVPVLYLHRWKKILLRLLPHSPPQNGVDTDHPRPSHPKSQNLRSPTPHAANPSTARDLHGTARH